MHRLVLLLLLGCGSTGPDADHVPQVGRYDYQLDHQGVHLSADLVVLDASATQVRYRFFTEGQASQNVTATVQYTNESWIANAFLPGRSAANIVTREGNGYRCTATVLKLTTFSPGTCSITFEGPDSLRTAP